MLVRCLEKVPNCGLGFGGESHGAKYSFSNHGSGKWLYLKGNDPIGDTPIFDFHDYGRKDKP